MEFKNNISNGSKYLNALPCSNNDAAILHKNTAASFQSNNVLSMPTPEVLRANAINPNIKPYSYIGETSLPYINEKAKLYKLQNGQNIIIVPKEGPTVIRTFIKVGSMNEPDDIRGISHYIEHNLFNGSKELEPGKFVELVTRMGGKYNASTGFMTTDYFIQSGNHTPEDFHTSLKLHADMIQNPTYPEDMLVKEKGPVTSEIQMLGDNPGNIAVNTTLKNLFGIKTKSLDIIGGTVENIQKLTKDKVVEYYKKWYTPDNMTTVVVGDLNPEATIGMISRYFANNPNKEPNSSKYAELLSPIQKSVRTDITNSNIQSVMLNMAFAGPKNDDIKDYVAVEALTTALTGYKNAKLTKALKPYNSEPNAAVETISPNLKDPSAIIFDTSFKPGEEEQGLKTIYSTIHEMAYKPLDNNEILIVKNKLKDSLKYLSESSMDISSFVGHSILDHGDLKQYSNCIMAIDSLTPNDIMEAAKKYLDLNKAAITVLHPLNTPKPENSQVAFCGTTVKTGKISGYKLSNNVDLHINQVNNAPITSAYIEFENKNAPLSRPGVSEILDRMMSYGTAINDEEKFENLKDINNINSGVSCGARSIIAKSNCAKESLEIALNMAKENVLLPSLTQENFERAKKELQLAYMSTKKSAEDRALEELYPNHPIGQTFRKAIENLNSINLQEVKAHYDNIMSNAEVKSVITGDIPESNLSKISNILGKDIYSQDKLDVNSSASVDLQNNVIILESEPRNQADIVQMFKIRETGNVRDKATILLLNEILGGNSNSRLFNDLREQQKLAYRVKSTYSESDKDGILELRILTTTENGYNGSQFDNVKKSLNGFDKHVKKMIEEPVTASELEAAKLKVKSEYIFASESINGKNALASISLRTPYKAAYIKELMNAIDTVSPQDIQKLAGYYLNKPSVTSLIAGKNTIEANKTYLASLGNLKQVN